jgi:aspartate kinase
VRARYPLGAMEQGVIKVMKFGGAALKDGPGVRRVVDIVTHHGGEAPVVVVSALEGVTDLLVDAARAAARGEVNSDAIRIRHRSVLAQLSADPELLDRYSRELSLILESIRGRRELGAVELDHVLSFGERASARIVAKCFENQGIMATPVDSYDLGLKTDSNHGNARPLSPTRATLERSILEIPGIPVVTGFLAKDGEGNLTTLGRNGSDLSAALLAEAVEAEAVEFWKGVPGVLSADPAVVPEARSIERLCFADAEELGHLGARILHPDAIAPAVRAGVEVRVRFVKDPSHPGTVLVKEELGVGPVAVVATVHEAREAVALVGANNEESGALARRALEERGLSADWTGRSKSGRAVFLGVKPGEVLEALRAVHGALFESGL